jgi:endo-1,4-beta-D-glucanase Y
MSTKKIFVIILALISQKEILFAQSNRPFPQHAQYFRETILPNHISRNAMDEAVRSFYDEWKERYIHDDCGIGEYYIWFENTSGGKQCVSEGQGYGMIIVALMAGYDTAAKTIYDGLFRYCKSHPAKKNPQLMSWAQGKDCKNIDGSSATDGDLDIAYSLLLANKQWGSKGKIDYLHEARMMITSIMKHEINQQTYSVLLSNEVENDSKDYFDMRSSDFMPAHFKAFQKATGDSSWSKVIDNNYVLFQSLQKKYSPEAGLLPDFIQHVQSDAQPAHPGYLESRNDGLYNYNACRIPWRVATDYLFDGDKRSKIILDKINRWIRETTQDNPDNISAGYTLAGEDLKKRNYEALSFITPFAVASMIDKKNQSWLNALWDYIVQFKLESFDYYDNSIKMVNMLLLSGNYWKP